MCIRDRLASSPLGLSFLDIIQASLPQTEYVVRGHPYPGNDPEPVSYTHLTNLIGQHREFYTVILADMLQHG